jgi:hypothetical protein
MRVSIIRRFLAVAFAIIILLMQPSFARASDVEAILEQGMRESLMRIGINARTADGIARRYMFIGTVMLQNPRHFSVADEDALALQSEKTGVALGKALGYAYNVYGDKKLQDAATVMMHSVRAGVLVDAASETFSALAANGYAFDAAVSVLHETSELVRSSLLPDRGAALCARIRKMAAGKEKVQAVRKEILLASEREKTRQETMLAAKREADRKEINAGKDRDRIAADRSAPSRGGSGVVASSGGNGSAGTNSGTTAGGAIGSSGSTNAGGTAGSNGGTNAGNDSAGSSGSASAGNDSAGSNGGSNAGNDGSGSNGGSNAGNEGAGSDGGSSAGNDSGGSDGGSNAGNEGADSNGGSNADSQSGSEE